MSALVLMGLLLFKHALLSHVVDLGYSKSRRATVVSWKEYLMLQCVIECAVTWLLVHVSDINGLLYFLVLEVLGLVACARAERAATYKNLLAVHLLCEFMMVNVYVLAYLLAANLHV